MDVGEEVKVVTVEPVAPPAAVPVEPDAVPVEPDAVPPDPAAPEPDRTGTPAAVPTGSAP